MCDADFKESIFNGSTYFYEDAFDKEANFNDVVFKGIISFYSTRFKDEALFWNTTFSKNLSLLRTRYEKIYIRWNDINGSLIYDDAAYMSLMKNFQNLGYFEDYDSCYEQYMKERRNQVG